MRELILDANVLVRFLVQRSSVDFADAWLAATAAETHREVVSFDRDLDRFTDVKRFEPTA